MEKTEMRAWEMGEGLRGRSGRRARAVRIFCPARVMASADLSSSQDQGGAHSTRMHYPNRGPGAVPHL